MAGGGESLGVHTSIDGVASEHPAEEHDLGYQEDPHAESRGVQLLGAVIEVVPRRPDSCTASVISLSANLHFLLFAGVVVGRLGHDRWMFGRDWNVGGGVG